MSVYSESDKIRRHIKQGIIQIGSTVRLKHPSGNSQDVRIHGFDLKADRMSGCDMGWDNGASQYYDLSNCIVELIEEAQRHSCKTYFEWHNKE